nr:MAG TPA: hypothetical protein [Caudoviricetes sp.]
MVLLQVATVRLRPVCLCAAVSRDVMEGAVWLSDGLTGCPGTGVRGRGLRGPAGRVAVAGLPVGEWSHYSPTTPLLCA